MANDTWVRGNLSTLFSGQVPILNKSKELLNTLKTQVDTITATFTAKGQAVSAGLELSVTSINALENTGINFLMLPPKSEPFDSRIATADNKPTYDQFTAGVVIFVQGLSIQETTEKYMALINAIKNTEILNIQNNHIPNAE